MPHVRRAGSDKFLVTADPKDRRPSRKSYTRSRSSTDASGKVTLVSAASAKSVQIKREKAREAAFLLLSRPTRKTTSDPKVRRKAAPRKRTSGPY